MAHAYMSHEKGVLFFTGEFLPQKSDLAPPLERRYISVQRHVPFYILKRSPGCFVYTQRTLRTNVPLHISALNSLRGANTVGVSNPARVKAREAWHDWGYLFSMIIKKRHISLSIETDVLPVQINTALN
jgi:hypothetical protein